MRKNINNNKGAFTLVEILIALAIVAILAFMGIKMFSTDGAEDKVRQKAITDMSSFLNDFKQKYGVYPNSSSHGRLYPAGCSAGGYTSLVDCLVSEGTLVKDTPTYDSVRFDPKDGTKSEYDKDFALYYGTAKNGTKFKLCALMAKQDNSMLKGLDGNTAALGSRYFCLVSDNTLPTEVTEMTK